MKVTINTAAQVGSLTSEFSRFHLSRPLPEDVLKTLLNKARSITMSRSTYNRMSKEARNALKYSGKFEIIKMKAGRSLETDPNDIKEVQNLKREGLTVREIAEELGLTKSTVHYLSKYASAQRIKSGKEVVNL